MSVTSTMHHASISNSAKSMGRAVPPPAPQGAPATVAAAATGDRDWLRMDFFLLALAMLLALFGLVMVYSASSFMASKQYGSASYFFVRQCVYAALGVGAMSFLAFMPLRRIYKFTYPMLLFTGALLLAVIATPLGVEVNGATRWMRLGIFNIQPLELAKISLVFYLAWFFSEKQHLVGSFSVGVVPPFAVTGLFGILTLMQPDFGGAAMMIMILFLMCFVGGTRLIYLGISVGMALAGGWWLIASSAYRWKRMTAFIDPFADALGAGYQIVQSLYAFGTGGAWGVGLAASQQKRMFLPEAHNDFIMSVVGEELGFVGVSAVFLLVGLLCWRAFHIAYTVEDLRDRLTAYGLSLILTLGAVLNMAVVLGAAPPKGVPMPFLSYGGSALLSAFVCIGLLLNLSRQPRAHGVR